MEIKPNGKIPAPFDPTKSVASQRPATKTFGTIFEEFMGNSNPLDEGDKKTPAIPNISTLQINPFMTGEGMPIVDRAEKMLDTLVDYQQKLANPGFTLREISPLIAEMEAENEILVSAANSLSDGDELKNILNQIIITSSVEIIKFNRGDYVIP